MSSKRLNFDIDEYDENQQYEKEINIYKEQEIEKINNYLKINDNINDSMNLTCLVCNKKFNLNKNSELSKLLKNYKLYHKKLLNLINNKIFDMNSYYIAKNNTSRYKLNYKNLNYCCINYFSYRFFDDNFFISDVEIQDKENNVIIDDEKYFLIKCNGCATSLSNKFDYFNPKFSLKENLDKLKIKRICCRKNFMNPILYPSKSYQIKNFEAEPNLVKYENKLSKIYENMPIYELNNMNNKEKEQWEKEVKKYLEELEEYRNAGVEVPYFDFKDMNIDNLESEYAGGDSKYTLKLKNYTF